MADFTIDDGFGICLNPVYRNFGVRNDYLLLDTKREIEICNDDPRWYYISSLT